MRHDKQRLSVFAWVLAFALLISGCATQNDGSTEATGQESTVQEQSQTETESSSADLSAVAKEQLPAVTELNANLNAVIMDFAATNEQFGGDTLQMSLSYRTGDLPDLEVAQPEQIEEEKAAELNRAMRAYKNGVDDDLIINDAPAYYFYDQLSNDRKVIYDAFYLLGQDPTTTDNVVTFQTTKDPASEEFTNDLFITLFGFGYDHPEMWWLYFWNGMVEFNIGYDEPVNGKTTVYLYYTKAYENFEQDVRAFNAAVESFLSGIDQFASDEEKALQVHDKLLRMCTYDQAILQEGKNDFGHTAFGPFVSNTEGTPHYCVCDGYALAYMYALQQLGIEATVVTGMAGNAGADGGMGGHAWSIVLLDGKWTEIDVCWDDSFDTYKEQVEAAYAPTSQEYKYYMECLENDVYMYKLEHHMYRLTTQAIQNYKAPSSLTYTTKDGKVRIGFVGDSQRQRFCDYADTAKTPQGLMTKLLPIADGKTYADGKTEENDRSKEKGETGKKEDSGNAGNSGQEESGEEFGNDITDLIKGNYQQLAGTYYVSQFNNYTEATLKKYYGDEYYKQLSMFELRADGSGTIFENGSSLDFTFYFDGYCIYMFTTNGGSLWLAHQNGKFMLYDYFGNVYTFSKM